MKPAQFFSFGFLVLVLAACHRYQLPTAAQTQHYVMQPATDSLPASPNTAQIATLLAPYQTELADRMNEVIGQAPRALPKRKPESPLGNWICDALQERAQQLSTLPVAVSVQNYGGIRIPELPAGDITVGKIYELMPFDNTLVIVALSAELTQRLFDKIAADGGWPVSKQVQFTIKDSKAQNLLIGGQALQSKRTYHIAMPDYIANGGDDCAFLQDLARQKTGILIRDILIDHVRKLSTSKQTVTAENSGRILAHDQN